MDRDGIVRPVSAPPENRRRSRTRLLVACGLAVAVAALVSGLSIGCAPGSRAAADAGYFGDTSPPHGQTFTFNNGAEPEHLDPAIMSGQPDGRIARMVFEGLCANDPATLAPTPGQAYRWDVSDDQLRYTFHLRPGLEWADGTPLTARDFLWSWRRVLDPKTASRYVSFLYVVKGAEAYNKGESTDVERVGLSAPDDSTFVVDLAFPVPYFLSMASYYPMLPTPRHVIEKKGELWERALEIVGNGPFRIVEWKQKDRFVLVKNERYWDRANVRLEKIVALPVDDNRTSTNLYKAGVIDWNPSGYVPKQVIPFMKHYKDFSAGPFHGMYFYSMVVERPPFDNVWVRRAFNYATDREAIANDVLKGTVIPWGNMTPMGYEGYHAPPAVKFDPERARECLAKAGYPGGKGFPKVELLFNTSEDHRLIAEALQAMWKRELNVRVELSNQEWASYLNATTTKNYQIARRSWIGDYLDPSTFLTMWTSGDGNNRTGWSSARYDALVRAAGSESDPARRLDLLSQAEGVLLDELPVLPIYHYVSSDLVKPYVRGISPTLLDFHPLKGVWIDHGGEPVAEAAR
jgi:ABC-type oligopeptide transport system substrate-binding subunit